MHVEREPFQIIRSDNFGVLFAEYFGSEAGKSLSESFNEKRPRFRESTPNYRVVSHWHKVGVLEDQRPDGKGWRRYSVIDMVWIRIVMSLRKFGVSLENILKIKESLDGKADTSVWEREGDILKKKYDPKDRISFSEHPALENAAFITKWNLLEFFVATVFATRRSAFFVVFEDFTCDIAEQGDINESRKVGAFLDAIQISLNGILQWIYVGRDLSQRVDPPLLSEAEFELLATLRSEEIEKITILTKDGNIDLIEKQYTIAADTRIGQLIAEGGYQRISLELQNGRVVAIEQTVKNKMSRK